MKPALDLYVSRFLKKCLIEFESYRPYGELLDNQAMGFLVREHGFIGPIIERPFPGLFKVRDLGLVEVEGDIEAPLQDSVRQQILKRYADLIAKYLIAKYAPEVLTGSANIFQLAT